MTVKCECGECGTALNCPAVFAGSNSGAADGSTACSEVDVLRLRSAIADKACEGSMQDGGNLSTDGRVIYWRAAPVVVEHPETLAIIINWPRFTGAGEQQVLDQVVMQLQALLPVHVTVRLSRVNGPTQVIAEADRVRREETEK